MRLLFCMGLIAVRVVTTLLTKDATVLILTSFLAFVVSKSKNSIDLEIKSDNLLMSERMQEAYDRQIADIEKEYPDDYCDGRR